MSAIGTCVGAQIAYILDLGMAKACPTSDSQTQNQAQKSKKGRRVGKTPTPPNPMPPRRWTSSIYIPPVDKRLGGYAEAGTTTLSALLTVSKADKGLLRLKVQLDRSNLGLRAQTASLECKQATT